MAFQLLNPRTQISMNSVTATTAVLIDPNTTILDINTKGIDCLIKWSNAGTVCTTSNADANLSGIHHFTGPFTGEFCRFSIVQADGSAPSGGVIVIQSK